MKAIINEKKVGRPKRCRRKQPSKIQGKHGPKLTRHGLVITCSYCKRGNHNSKGCFLKKNSIKPKDYVEEEEQNDTEAAQNDNEPQMVPPVHDDLPSS